MFPYIDTSSWWISPSAALVALALGAGYLIALRRVRESGIDREFFTKLGLCVIAGAFVGGHLLRVLSQPGALRMLLSYPSLAINLLNGQASFGVFFGGFLAGLAAMSWYKVPYRDWYVYPDAVAFAIPFSCWLVRLGCYLVHDHPGIRTSSFLGVRYPGGTRFDLGLLEALFLLLLALVFLILDRKPRPRGFYFVVLLFSYATVRLVLDNLRVQPERYGGWTMDQIAATAMMFIAALCTADLLRLRWNVRSVQ